MHFRPGKRTIMLFWALAALLLLPLAASADPIAVTPTYFTGSRSTPNASGVVGAGSWSDTNGGFLISWDITSISGGYHYSYTISNANGSTPIIQDMSHLILEVSSCFTSSDIWNATLDGEAVSVVGPQTFTSSGSSGSNPNMPASDIFGIKLDAGGITYAFDSNKMPVWGDFYAKDGNNLVDDVASTAWNMGFGTDPTNSTTDFTNWIPTPDTCETPVPLPPSALLLGSGLLGLCLFGWRRREKKA